MRSSRRARWQRWLVLALLWVFFALTVTTLPRLSLTADEPVYVGAGYAFLRSGDLRMATSAQHPPLMQELVALPLTLAPGPEPEDLAGWDTAEMVRFAPAFLAWYGERLDATTFAARLPVALLALLWAAFIFRWAADWFGGWGGLLALTLFVFDPNVLAHATLATNDVGFAAFSFVALFAAMRLLRRRRSASARGHLLLAGLALGASLSSKSSGFFSALTLGALFLATALSQRRRRGSMRLMLQLSGILSIGLLVLWASYGFETRPFPLATQWEVWQEMRDHLSGGHTAYLMGEVRDAGGLAYYPLTFVLKTPSFTLLLLALGLVGALAAGPRRWLATLPLWIFVGGYSAATLLSRVSTGYRFLLPLLPFVFILVAGLLGEGGTISRFGQSRIKALRRLRGVSWAILVALGLSVVIRFHPHYLTYFNFLAGGSAGGHRFLVDSNLDWGQSFVALEEDLEQRGIEDVRLSHYVYADPALYGVQYEPLPPRPAAPPILPRRFNPAPGVYAIGATTLQGVQVVDPDMYSWFRQRQPVARPGNAIFLYRVTERRPEPTWLAQCSVPVAPLTPGVAAEGLGRDDLRLAFFDCTQSWLYPTGGERPGWYGLHRETALSGDEFVAQRLAKARLSYQQRRDGASPAFRLYEQATARLPAGCSAEPAPFDGPLVFLGYTAPEEPAHPGDTVEVETCWRVTAPLPGLRPLSLMLHLVGPGGAPAVVGDGLGVPVEQWRVGDVLVQRHRLVLPADAPTGDYDLATGAYWLDTLERWPVLMDEKPAGDQLMLEPISVIAGG